MADGAGRPSPAWGLRQALLLWKLVLAVWIVPGLLLLPPSLAAAALINDRLGNLPDDGGAPGDVLAIVAHMVLDHGPAIGLTVAAAVALSFVWTVVWHAGVVRWQQWAATPRPHLAEVVGHGLVGFWPFARLAATASVASIASGVAVWAPLAMAMESARAAMADDRVVLLALTGAAFTVALAVLLWAATLRAAWLLAIPGRRSAVVAWLRACADTVRSPLSSLGVVLLWTVPAFGLGLLQLAVGASLPAAAAAVLSQGTALLRALCWVALFCSFATVTGLWPPERDDDSEVLNEVLGDERATPRP